MAIFKKFPYSSCIQISIVASLLLLLFIDEVFTKSPEEQRLRVAKAKPDEYQEFYDYLEDMKDSDWPKDYSYPSKKRKLKKKPKDNVKKPKEYNYIPSFLNNN